MKMSLKHSYMKCEHHIYLGTAQSDRISNIQTKIMRLSETSALICTCMCTDVCSDIILGPLSLHMLRIWAASSISKMCWFRWSCACVKYHPGLCSLFIHSVVYATNDSVSGQWIFWSDCVNKEADLDLRWPCMLEDTFSYGTVHI